MDRKKEWKNDQKEYTRGKFFKHIFGKVYKQPGFLCSFNQYIISVLG